MTQVPEDSDMYGAFGEMSQIWEIFKRSNVDESATKKSRREGPPARKESVDQVMKLLQAMGHLLIKLDVEQRVLKKQDSWICFMQTESQALLPLMMEQAGVWKKQQETTRETLQPHQACSSEMSPVDLLSPDPARAPEQTDSERCQRPADGHGPETWSPEPRRRLSFCGIRRPRHFRPHLSSPSHPTGC